MGQSLLRVAALAVVALGVTALTTGVVTAADPDALWKIVHDRCLPAQQKGGAPDPCQWLDPDQGYAILKDRDGVLQYLLIPTARIPGIESPQVLSPTAPNYWQAAWEARRFLEDRAGQPIPRDDIALAINSEYGRTQNQLHIHIDCVRTDVKRILRDDEDEITANWAPLPGGKLRGHPYLVKRLAQEDLSSVNPFALLANGVPGARANMGRQTLVVVGATFNTARDGNYDGFYLLTDHAALASADRASGDELLDHSCAVLKDGDGS